MVSEDHKLAYAQTSDHLSPAGKWADWLWKGITYRVGGSAKDDHSATADYRLYCCFDVETHLERSGRVTVCYGVLRR